MLSYNVMVSILQPMSMEVILKLSLALLLLASQHAPATAVVPGRVPVTLRRRRDALPVRHRLAVLAAQVLQRQLAHGSS